MTNSSAADSGFADTEAAREPSVIHGNFQAPLQALGQNGQSAAAGALSSGTNQGGVSNSATNTYTDYHDDGSRSEYWEDGIAWWFLDFIQHLNHDSTTIDRIAEAVEIQIGYSQAMRN